METEDILQFIWKQELYQKEKLRTSCGIALEIIRCGEQNFNAGPDFINARIRIDQVEWAGNVEIHRQSSDWEKHGHHHDPSYNNVILHVVRTLDSTTRNSCGRRIHTLVMEYPEDLLKRYHELKAGDSCLPCKNFILTIPTVRLQRWITLLQAERLVQKTGRISDLLLHRGQGWDETFYLALASGFGLPINSLPFELLASGIPLKLLLNTRDHPTELEAILFGQAGFLCAGKDQGPYLRGLLEKYRKRKHTLKEQPLQVHLWKFLRLRPISFPTIRISQFASLVHRRFPMMDTILYSTSLSETEQLLRVSASEYWNTHYVFGKCSPESEKFLGQQSLRILIINVIVPFLFAYGRMESRKDAINQGAHILASLESESNHIINNWIKFGVKPCNAFESQALIQLHNVYCKQKRCLDCQIGAGFLTAAFHEEK